MNYRIEDIPPEGLQAQGERGGAWLEELFQGQEASEFTWLSPVFYDIRISRSGVRVLVKGSIKLTLQCACSRCLEHADCVVNPEFNFCLLPAQSQTTHPEVELQREDLDIEFYSGDAIDIGEIIRNQIVLALPLNPLCREECKGLCPYCGINKNHDTCECSGETMINPKMAILEDFFKK